MIQNRTIKNAVRNVNNQVVKIIYSVCTHFTLFLGRLCVKTARYRGTVYRDDSDLSSSDDYDSSDNASAYSDYNNRYGPGYYDYDYE